jgi:hypothetical protein
MTDRSEAVDQSVAVYVKGLIQGQMFAIKDLQFIQTMGVGVSFTPESGHALEIANSWDFTFANGGVLKVTFSYEENPYQSCKHCGREIYDDGVDGQVTWMDRQDENWVCPARQKKFSSRPTDLVHEPKEE